MSKKAQSDSGIEDLQPTPGRPTEYTKSDMLDAVTRVALELEERPTTREYSELRTEDEPSHSTITRVLGQWNDVLDRVAQRVDIDLPDNRGDGHGVTGRGRDYDLEDCVEALKTVCDELEQTHVTKDTYAAEQSDWMPCYQTIRDRCGSWREAHEQANLCPVSSDIVNKLFQEGPLVRDAFDQGVTSRFRMSPVDIRRFTLSTSVGSRSIGSPPMVYYVATKHPFEDVIATFLDHADRLVEHGREYVRELIGMKVSGVRGTVAMKTVDRYFDTEHDEYGLSAGDELAWDSSAVPEQYIEALHTVDDRVDGTLSIANYEAHRDDDHPTAEELRTEFDAWNDAKREAGIEPIVEREVRSYTEREIEAAVQIVTEHVGSIPSTTQYQHYREHYDDTLPSHATVCRRLGGWDDLEDRADVSLDE